MVDTGRLNAITPEERFHAQDDVERDARSKKAVSITLVHEPEMRTLRTGERAVILRGTEEGRSTPMAAIYAIPPRIEGNEAKSQAFDDTLRGLGGGDKLTLAGQWARRGWKDAQNVSHVAWEFKTQHFAKGEMSLEQVLDKARADRGESVARPVHEQVVEQKRATPARGAQRDGGMGV